MPANTCRGLGMLLACLVLLGVVVSRAMAQPSARGLTIGMKPREVQGLKGFPSRINRQILLGKHVEQWIYGPPGFLRLEFTCPRGSESWLSRIHPSATGTH